MNKIFIFPLLSLLSLTATCQGAPTQTEVIDWIKATCPPPVIAPTTQVSVLVAQELDRKPWEATFVSTAKFTAWRNEILGITIKNDGVEIPTPANVTVYRIDKVAITIPSFKGADLTHNDDKLVPVNVIGKGIYFLEWQSSVSGVFKPLPNIEVTVLDKVIPDFPVFPVYSELQTWSLVKQTGSAQTVDTQNALGDKYVAEMQKHRMYAYQDFTSGYADREYWYKRVHPKQLFFIPKNNQTATRIGEWDAWLKLKGRRGVSYTIDEPGTQDLTTLLKPFKTLATNIDTFVTTSTPNQYLDLRCPNYTALKTKGAPVSGYACLYESCMVVGCDSNGVSYPFADLSAIESSGTKASMFAKQMYDAGAKFGLYYAVNERTEGTIHFAGNNGDGTLFYADSTGLVQPSLRLKFFRYGSFQLDKVQQ